MSAGVGKTATFLAHNGWVELQPWLSVVIPSHFGADWIQAALHSVAREQDSGIEVLVVDSGPTATARMIARGFSDRLSVRIFERPDLSSWQAKTNFAVGIARSNHLCWLGVDDVWLPGRAAAARGWIDADPGVALHLAPSAIIDKHARRLGTWRGPFCTTGELVATLLIERLLIQNFVAAPAPVFRKDAWLETGGLDEKLWYTADWDIWLKLAAGGRTFYHTDVTTGFRIHAHSLTTIGSCDTGELRLQMQTVLDRHLGKLDSRSKGVERAARASIAVNAALAAASRAKVGDLVNAAWQVALLGPTGIKRFLRDSRIVDRLAPRVRAKLSGTF